MERATHNWLTYFGLIITCIISIQVNGQYSANPGYIREMKWGMDYRVYLYLTNDSSVVMNVKDLPRVSRESEESVEQFTFIPVNLDTRYVDFIRAGKFQNPADSSTVETLWSSLHSALGGGWIHFINCLSFALESKTLDLKSPLMKRPETKWKPDPPTESWRRTRKWKYYIPDNQKLAIKEYNRKERKGELNLLAGVPREFINLFLSTNDAEYKKMEKEGNRRDLARINMVRLLVGANYLGKAQLSYIRSMVLQAALKYPAQTLPSVILVEEYNAIVAMWLDETGYKIDRIVFGNESGLDEHLRVERTAQINKFINEINEKNRLTFEVMLKQYFNKTKK